ncbi:MAG: ECF-type sigma factor [Acidobacteriota bacterium]
MSAPETSVTGLLQDWSRGDQSALEKLTPLVYSELRRVAAGYMKRERAGHTLQPTELVHEVFLRLVGQKTPDFRNRAHFMAIAAQHMRQILVDHARKRARLKRGGRTRRITLAALSIAAPGSRVDFLALNEALAALAEFDARKSRILEMHFFGGMGEEEIAAVLGVHTNTVARDLRLARAWLQARLRS